MRVIDQSTWPRKEMFDFYSGISRPFYMVTFKVDVTRLYRYAKAHGLSFYLSMIYLCTETVNELETFRYAVRDGEVVLLDGRDPVFCDLNKGEEIFRIVNVERGGTMEEFCRRAKAKSLAQKGFMPEPVRDDQIIFSCLPWVDLTAITNEHELKADNAADDTDLLLAWGKFEEENGRKILNVSIDVNHRFIDGLSIGRFAEGLEKKIAALEL